MNCIKAVVNVNMTKYESTFGKVFLLLFYFLFFSVKEELDIFLTLTLIESENHLEPDWKSRIENITVPNPSNGWGMYGNSVLFLANWENI